MSRRIFLFSNKEIFKDVSTESFQFPNATNAEVFLAIFGENLEMLAESKISGITMPPQKHFAKDGKIWMFVIVEDELGFARISMVSKLLRRHHAEKWGCVILIIQKNNK